MSVYFFDSSGEFRSPPATLAMVAGGGDRNMGLTLLLVQALEVKSRYMLLLHVIPVICFVVSFSGETVTTGHRDHGGRWWWS